MRHFIHINNNELHFTLFPFLVCAMDRVFNIYIFCKSLYIAILYMRQSRHNNAFNDVCHYLHVCLHFTLFTSHF